MASRQPLIPDPLNSLEQYSRHHHLDLKDRDDEELSDELHALRPLLWGLGPGHWLRERVRFLQGEINRRMLGRGYQTGKRPLSEQAEGVKL